MGLYKRGNIYGYRFVWNGELIRDSTRQTNKRVAQQVAEQSENPVPQNRTNQ